MKLIVDKPQVVLPDWCGSNGMSYSNGKNRNALLARNAGKQMATLGIVIQISCCRLQYVK